MITPPLGGFWVSSFGVFSMCFSRLFFGRFLEPFWKHFGLLGDPKGSQKGAKREVFGGTPFGGAFWEDLGSILGGFGEDFGSFLGVFWFFWGSF